MRDTKVQLASLDGERLHANGCSPQDTIGDDGHTQGPEGIHKHQASDDEATLPEQHKELKQKPEKEIPTTRLR